MREGAFRTRVRYVYTRTHPPAHGTTTAPTASPDAARDLTPTDLTPTTVDGGSSSTSSSRSVTGALRAEETFFYDFSLSGITIIREMFTSPATSSSPQQAQHLLSTSLVGIEDGVDRGSSANSNGNKCRHLNSKLVTEPQISGQTRSIFLPPGPSGVIEYDAATPGAGIYDPQESGEPYVELRLPGRLTLLFPRGLRADGRAVLTMEWLGKVMRYQLDRKFTTLRRGAIDTLELTEIRIGDANKWPPGFLEPPPFLK